MKMKKLFLSLLLAMFGTVAMMAQMEMPSVPVDPDVRIGKLDNGLTYYIRYNNWPENRAEPCALQSAAKAFEKPSHMDLPLLMTSTALS